ncbi:unnamed protein product [Polarella glacialis]|uniref:Uncharacterized protein n=1 Tax=Polarella glacialis TaxID=89957 RepID=A0A813IB95_POLGL|nr:unnamed protein product [Polarella glacialis]CAE8647822.1 unnamed protein product [Polarella glacialis]
MQGLRPSKNAIHKQTAALSANVGYQFVDGAGQAPVPNPNASNASLRSDVTIPSNASYSSSRSMAPACAAGAVQAEVSRTFFGTLMRALPRVSDWHISVSLQQLCAFAPAAGDGQGFMLWCNTHCSSTPVGVRLVVSKLSVTASDACPPCPSDQFVPPAGPVKGAVYLLHPCRLRLQLRLDSNLLGCPSCLSCRLEVDPLRGSLRTADAPLLRGIAQLLVHFADELLSLSPQGSSTGGKADLGQISLLAAAEGLLPRTMLTLLHRLWDVLENCSLELEAELAALRVGLVHSPSDAERCIILVEDAAMVLERGPPLPAVPGARSYRGSDIVPTTGRHASLEVALTSKRRFLLDGKVGAVSVVVISMDTAQTSTFLEPVHMCFGLRAGSKSEPSWCRVSWLNLNVSVALVNTLVSLFRDAAKTCEEEEDEEDAVQEAGAAGAGRTELAGGAAAPPADELSGRQYQCHLPELALNSLAAAPALSVCLSTAVTLPLAPSQAEHTFRRQASISSRLPEIGFFNGLGQDVKLNLQGSSIGNEWQLLDRGETLKTTMPLSVFRGSHGDDDRDCQGWKAHMRLTMMAHSPVWLTVSPTPKLQTLLVRSVQPDRPDKSMSLTSLASLSTTSCLDCTCKQNGNSDELEPHGSRPRPDGCCWILVRKEAGRRLHQLDVHLSSTIFLENRTCLPVSVAPFGADDDEWLELEPGGEPRPVPLSWCVGTAGAMPAMLWCALTSQLKPSLRHGGTGSLSATTDSGSEPDLEAGISKGYHRHHPKFWHRGLRRKGVLQPLFGKGSWRAMCRYHSMDASDYYLRSRELLLYDANGAMAAKLCSTVYGISSDLEASGQALFFSVAIEPLVQISNRLPCLLHTGPADQMALQPGEDQDVILPSEALRLMVEVPGGQLLTLAAPIWPDRLPREGHQRQLVFHEGHAGDSKEDGGKAKLVVTLGTELGLTLSEHWAPLQVHQYSPRARRLVVFTQYWLMNRRSDCRVCVPCWSAVCGSGVDGSSTSLVEKSRLTLALQHFECNSMSMLSEDLVRKGQLRVGLCDQRYNANGEALVPVTRAFRVDRPLVGAATAPRTVRNPVQRCFGYTVRPAPFPFYRSLVVEVVRRFTLLNHKQHVLHCCERGVYLPPMELAAGSHAAFDPQGEFLQLAVSGLGLHDACQHRPRSHSLILGQSSGLISDGLPQRIRSFFSESASPQRTQSRSTAGVSSPCGLPNDSGQACEGYSAFFGLDVEGSRSHFQLLHQVDLACFASDEVCALSYLARPEPLIGPAEVPAAHGRAWCLTAVDTLVEQSSVVVRFAEPLRPLFRIVNRTGHPLGLHQDFDGSPRLELPPETRMSFCWFQPGKANERLKLRLGHEEHSYDVCTVQEHQLRLHVEKPPVGSSASWWREEFQVCTRVVKGSREVHVYPWCRLTNFTSQSLLIRSSPTNEVLVPAAGSVCLQPISNSSACLFLQIRSSGSDGRLNACDATWSQPIKLAKALSGSHGFLRHLQSGGAGLTSEFRITMVEVKRDPVSNFLVVELKPYVQSKSPYLFENLSSYDCNVMQVGEDADTVGSNLMPGERAPFLPLGLCGGKGSAVNVRLSFEDCSAVTSPKLEGDGRKCFTALVDIECPQELAVGQIHVEVLKERPRRIIIRDAEEVKEQHRRLSRREQTSVIPALFVTRRLLGSPPRPRHGWAMLQQWKGRSDKTGKRTAAVPAPPFGRYSGVSQLAPGLPAGGGSNGEPEVVTVPSAVSLPSLGPLLPRRPRLPTLSAPSPRGSPCRASTPFRSCASSPIAGASISPRRSSRDVFWQRCETRLAAAKQGSVFELCLEGAGVTLVDSTAMQEVAYLCAEHLEVRCVMHEGLQRELEMTLRSLQADVHEASHWRSHVMLRPRRSRLPSPASMFSHVPFACCTARWLALDSGAGAAAHLEVESLNVNVQPVELLLDTMNCFRLAQWALEMAHCASPMLELLAVQPLLSKKRTQSAEKLLRARTGDADDPVLGEPPCPLHGDFKVPMPVFIKHLLVRRIQVFLSVRFSGKGVGDCQGGEELQAVDLILRKLIPFDVSHARISLGPVLRQRRASGGSVGSSSSAWSLGSDKSVRWWARPWACCGRSTNADALLQDEFLPDGLFDLFAEALSESSAAVVRQIPQLLGAQRFLGSPAHLLTELSHVTSLLWLAVCGCNAWLFLAAALVGIAAILQSVEGILLIVAKTTCRVSAGTVPAGLRKEPSGFPGAMMDLVWYGFPWHIRQVYREWQRQGRIAWSSQSWAVTVCCFLRGSWYSVSSILSSVMVMGAKLVQALHLLSRTLAWYVCPERVAEEFGAPLARRVGPMLFWLGAPLQYSHAVTAAVGVVHVFAHGTRHREWRLKQLPGGEGTLVAVRGSGFFLVRAGWACAWALCLPARDSDLHVTWQARGEWEVVELSLHRRQWILRLALRNSSRCEELRLKSRRAGIAAFSFAQECLSGWAHSEAHAQSAPDSPGRHRLLRKVRRSATMRARG